MAINSFYTKIQIPKHLQKHMLRVASVGEYLSENFKGQINKENIIKTLLLHDLGNLWKFDLSRGIDLFDENERDESYWLDVQKNMKINFDSEHTATLELARKTNVSDRVLFLLENMGSANLNKNLDSDDWELKICSYSDFRVTPYGFSTVIERFDDILKRYEGRSHILADEEKTKKKMQSCLKLEEQIQSRLNIKLNELSVEKLEERSKSLIKFEL